MDEGKQKKLFFKTCYYNQTYYHNVNRVFESHVRCKHDTKWEFLFLFHLQQIDLGRKKSKLSKTFLTRCVLCIFLLLKKLQNLAGKRDEINQLTKYKWKGFQSFSFGCTLTINHKIKFGSEPHKTKCILKQKHLNSKSENRFL